MSFRTGRVVLFGDCDAGGVVYTPRISDFVVEAALEFLSFARNAAGVEAFRATLTQVCVCSRTRRPVTVPSELRLALAGSYQQ